MSEVRTFRVTVLVAYEHREVRVIRARNVGDARRRGEAGDGELVEDEVSYRTAEAEATVVQEIEEGGDA